MSLMIFKSSREAKIRRELVRSSAMILVEPMTWISPETEARFMIWERRSVKVPGVEPAVPVEPIGLLKPPMPFTPMPPIPMPDPERP